MPSNSFELTTARSPAEVFDYLVDVRNSPEWIDAIVSATLVSGQPGTVGAGYDVTVHRAIASDATIRYELTDVDRPRHAATRVEAKAFSGTETIDVRPTEGGGSTITYRMEYEMNGAMKLATPLTMILEAATTPGLKAKLAERLDAGATTPSA